MIRIERIACDTAFHRLIPQWHALWRQVPSATPFQSPCWLLPWWRRFGTGAPVILTARRGDDDLIGVLPLYRLDEPGCRKLLPFGIGVTDYIDALIIPEQNGVADALLSAVATVVDWDECYLPELPPGAFLADAVTTCGLSEARDAETVCPVLELPATTEALTAALPRKTLRDLRQARARAGMLGPVSIEGADAATLDEALDDLFRLHEKRWRGRGEAGVCADPAVRGFHRDATRELLAAGMLRLYRLWIAGSVVAVYYGFAANAAAFAYLGGFDPELGAASPGALIIAHAVEQAIAEGCRTFHFLRGREAYKYTWGAVDRPNLARTFRRSEVTRVTPEVPGQC